MGFDRDIFIPLQPVEFPFLMWGMEPVPVIVSEKPLGVNLVCDQDESVADIRQLLQLPQVLVQLLLALSELASSEVLRTEVASQRVDDDQFHLDVPRHPLDLVDQQHLMC